MSIPVRGRRAQLLATVLTAAAATLAIVGSALPLFTAKFTAGPSLELTMTSWGMEVTGGFPFVDTPAYGYPLVFAAIVLATAAVWSRTAARPGARPRAQRVAVATVVAGGAFLACAVWIVAIQVANWAELYGPMDEPGQLVMESESSVLGGMWVLSAGALLGLAAMVPALLPSPEPVPVQPVPEEVDPEAPTPPYGIALPLEVDALTGEPVPEPPPADPPPPAPSPPVLQGPAVPLTDDPLAEPRRD